MGSIGLIAEKGRGKNSLADRTQHFTLEFGGFPES